MRRFQLNGRSWRIVQVNQNDPRLVERSGRRAVATTDPKTGCIYLSNELRGKFLTKVLLHELGHCTIFSFDLLDDIHRMVLPKYWFEAEEWVCNFIADYGESIFGVAYSILGEDAWALIPYELEKLIA